jgi:hypothetical protein
MWVRQEVSTAIAMERNLTYLYGTLFPCETELLASPAMGASRSGPISRSLQKRFTAC